ncbi:hypothetical protein ASE66_08505 [Bosea sp. Root483D1]|nr:hypothetical protein ASE66_08505 [Bosea sp. Root483D1]
MPPSITAARMPLPIAVAVMTPPQAVASWSPEVFQTTKLSSAIASSIWVRKVSSPETLVLGALFTVKAKPATVFSDLSGTSAFGRVCSVRQCSRTTSLIAPV